MVEIHSKEPMAMCPMASMCKGMAMKPPSLPVLILPGLVFIIFGVVILIEPKILVWLVAIVTILLGVMLSVIAIWIRRMFAQIHNTPG